MHLYIEESTADHPRTRSIIEKFPRASVVYARNYKNLFDVSHGTVAQEPSMIIARAPKNPVLPAPKGYGFDGPGLFLKTSIGCIYDCEYCYLKGMFRNEIPVYFIDYEYIWSELAKNIETIQPGNTSTIYIYCSDYSDIQGMDVFSNFNDFFLPKIESLSGVLMETRTKSASIDSLLHYSERKGAPSNIEVAYSLNPQEVIDAFERGTAPLSTRLKNIQTLLASGWKVGVRIMPLMPVENYEKIYTAFISELKDAITLDQLHSIFIGGLMFTKKDFKKMQKKGLLSSILDKVDSSDDTFVRLNQMYRAKFYALFREHLGDQCQVCLDTHIQF